MKTEKVTCDDLTAEEDGCALEVILREIINGQNHQIQVMRGLLESMDYPQEKDCKVAVSNVKNAAYLRQCLQVLVYQASTLCFR